ncbi:MAG TPA: TetR/AcrR family transcriptional regulator [Gemmatimonadales bacterium]|nr:TetR/AcrR family transcriptional regulator [Gemmatimonadales bacterium]
MSRARRSVRDRILETAGELFYGRGIRNVGVDEIVAASGVAKMSLYKHFESKDALIEAWLRESGARWQAWLEQRIQRAGCDPGTRLLAVFDALAEWFGESSFRGCFFLNSAVEVADPAHPASRLAVEHQTALLGLLRSLARETGVPRPEMLARQLLLLTQGAIVIAQVHGGPEAGREARRAAAALIAAAHGTTG